MTSNCTDAPAKDVHRSRWQRVLAYAFAAVCLIWVFHNLDARRVLAAMHIANWWLMVLAIVADILTYVLQALRWTQLLTPVGPLSVLRAAQGIYAGLFTNELIPLRVGELVRAFLISRWLPARVTEVLPSMVVERYLDALWLATAFGLAVIFVPLPKNLVEVGDALGVVVLLGTLLFLWTVFRQSKKPEPTKPNPCSSVFGVLQDFGLRLACGVGDIGVSYRLYLAALLSAAMLACQAFALWCMMLACRIDLPFGTAAIVLLIVRLGTCIPNAPANIGSFQFFTVLALGLFGEDKTVAAGFSMVYFLALSVPLWILGLVAISRTGISLSSIRSGVAVLRQQLRRA